LSFYNVNFISRDDQETSVLTKTKRVTIETMDTTDTELDDEGRNESKGLL